MLAGSLVPMLLRAARWVRSGPTRPAASIPVLCDTRHSAPSGRSPDRVSVHAGWLRCGATEVGPCHRSEVSVRLRNDVECHVGVLHPAELSRLATHAWCVRLHPHDGLAP